MFRCKLISQEGSFDKRLFCYKNSPRLVQIHWYPDERVYRVRPLDLQKPFEGDYYHEELVIFTNPNGRGEISWKLQD